MKTDHEFATCEYKSELELKCPKCALDLPIDTNAQSIKALTIKIIEVQEELNKLKTKVTNLVSQATLKEAEDDLKEKKEDEN